MNRILFFGVSLFFLTLSLPLFGQDSPAAPINESSLLWEISGNDLQTPSYLYGTIHMIGKEDFFLTDDTKTAFSACKRVTFEIDLAEMTGLFSQISLMMQMFMDDGLRLSDLLTEEEYQVVSDHFDEQGLPMFMLDRIKPLFLSAVADMDMGTMEPGNADSEMISYEFEFYDMAKSRKMETAGLETAEYQISLFDSIPYSVQAHMLLESIQAAPAEGGVDEMQMLVDLYKSQDIESMQHAFSSSDSEYAPYEELLLINRNLNWIPIMGKMMAEKPTFFAVGAGHLGGEQGVVNLLRQKGYTLRPINSKKP
ncbi:MAG: TraB/GumN family protein [Saprospiraceae bacterium]|nr:TraB/GumN family protein [Saprospiraceae bacterium]